jgi:hypothetical protein
MHYTIVIPTYKRIKKLERCIRSIRSSTHKDLEIFVLCDNEDLDTYHYLSDTYAGVVISLLMTKHRYVMGCWNYFTQNHLSMIKDAMVWLVDDVELYPNTLSEMDACFSKVFPDTDGVVGLSQECPGNPQYTYKPYGQSCLGKKFIERYKEVDYKVCCPEYIHFFQDEEMYQFSMGLSKFIHCEKAILKHYHPCFIKEEVDKTHFIVRDGTLQRDQKIFEERQSRGLIWGDSFMRIKI